MWDVSGPFVSSWMRDELGPEAAIAERVQGFAKTLRRLPDVIDRLESMVPTVGAAPEPPRCPRSR
jgi:ubiquinone biosynthesis protein